MNEIVIGTKKPYRFIITDSFAGLSEELDAIASGEKIFVVYDNNTKKLFSKEIRDELCGFPLTEICVPSGEKCKSFSSYKRLLEKLAEGGADRNSVILAVGGGAVSDLAGFAAATFMRGIKYCVFPTTLLSMIDASVGGKTAVDLSFGKNLAGAFYPPSLVYANTSCLDFLPLKEEESGMGEAVKYAFLSDEITAEDILGDRENLILKCVSFKNEIVKKDEFEKKPASGRVLLNLGHTVGHALEASRGYSLSHGLCVAYGIKRIIDLSADFYGLNSETVNEMKKLLNVYPFDFSFDADMRDIKSRIIFDKKVSGDKIRFVMLKGIGKAKVEKIPIAEMWKILK